MKTSEIFIANILDEIEQTDIDTFVGKTGLHADDIDELLEDTPKDTINAFLLSLHALGYKISSPDGQFVTYIEDI